MFTFFEELKQSINRRLDELLREKGSAGFQSGTLSPLMVDRLIDFAGRGKMIRGGLVMLGYRLFGGDPDSEQGHSVLDTAAVMELFQSALLIHDDIMDRDMIRRGMPSFFAQYSRDFQEAGLSDGYHLGESVAICGGDMAIFFGYEILGSLELEGSQLAALVSLFSREMTWVGMAQVADVIWGSSPELPREEDILNLYRFKTGRYTFSLPLMAGALLAGADTGAVEVIARAGELLGQGFQLKDDELDLWGAPDQLGKPVGTDIKEGKKTVHWLRLLNRVGPEDRRWLLSLPGKDEVSSQDIERVKALMEQQEIFQELAELIRHNSEKALALVEGLSHSDPETIKILHHLAHYNQQRTK